ncbi:hypothetical protein F5X96DRAFT_657633 [Biscogniauxia mediterranea]|nr:hypothetical protein F5X96DRAFT_657633 [Biscogniauxia mediterranea]
MHPPGTPNNHSRPPSTPSTPHNDAAYNAALRGASLAFQRSPVPKQQHQPSTTPKASLPSLDNGALIAATSASRDHSPSSSPPRAQASRLSQHTTGSSVQGGSSTPYAVEPGIVSQRLTQHAHFAPQGHHLLPPPKQTMADPRSPSFIAATLAASRSGSPSPRSKAQSQQNAQPASRRRRHGSVDANSTASSATSLDITTDTSPIPSANALISMFERGEDDTDPVKKGIGKSNANNKLTEAKPRPRPATPPRALSPVAKHDTSPTRSASTLAWEKAATPPASVKEAEREHAQQVPTTSIESRRRPPTPPPARSKGEVDISMHAKPPGLRAKPRATTPPPKTISRSETVILSPQPRRAATVNLQQTSSEAILTNQSRKPPPVKPKPRRPTSVPGTSTMPDDAGQVNATAALPKRPSSSSSNDTFVSASSAPSTHADSPRRGRSRPATPDPLRPPASMRSPLPPPRLSHASNLPLESLTNAIVAGSLASARMTSTSATPSRAPTPPPARKRAAHMRQTLRKPPSKSDDEDEKSRARRRSLGKLGSKGKHAHREGSRRRWREEITPRERKRYEGVWASNRGYLLSNGQNNNTEAMGGEGKGEGDGGDDSERVANVVVRDIWGRSRLPFDELAEVWDLVDRRGRGTLDKTEFVVGMWLVDQRLRGRKIPRKVSDSVWGSAKGVKVLGPKGDGKSKGKGKGKEKGRA